MRTFIITVICMILCIAPWTFYSNYSSEAISYSKSIINYNLIPEVTKENWQSAGLYFDEVYDCWQRHKRPALFFTDKELIALIDDTLARSEYYIAAKDISNASG